MKRDIVVCILLSIVTCGIYLFIWEYHLNQEISSMCGKQPDTDGASFILLILFTCNIYHIIWNYKMGSLIDEKRASEGNSSSSYGIIFLLLTIFSVSAFVSCALMQSELNKTAIA